MLVLYQNLLFYSLATLVHASASLSYSNLYFQAPKRLFRPCTFEPSTPSHVSQLWQLVRLMSRNVPRTVFKPSKLQSKNTSQAHNMTRSRLSSPPTFISMRSPSHPSQRTRSRQYQKNLRKFAWITCFLKALVCFGN